MDDVLVNYGGAVKVIGENRIGGYLVLFGSPDETDLVKDYFTADTNFDVESGERKSGYFNHGLDLTFKNMKIGRGTLTQDDTGMYLDAELKVFDADKWKAEKKAERQKYIQSVMELVEDGQCGLSSGSVSHLVRREKTGNSFKLLDWPIGEWSITHTPCEPRTQVMAVKTWQEESVSFEEMIAKKSAGEIKPPAEDVPSVVTSDKELDQAVQEARSAIELLNDMPLKSYLLEMRGVLREFERRVDWLSQDAASTKSGRVISADNLRAMSDIADGMDSAHSTLDTHRKKLRALVESHMKPAGNTPNTNAVAREFNRYMGTLAGAHMNL